MTDIDDSPVSPLPRLRRAVDGELFGRACAALDIAPERVLRDPTSMLPLAASASIEQAQEFLRLALEPGTAPDLSLLEEDVALLVTGNVFCHLAAAARKQRRRWRQVADRY